MTRISPLAAVRIDRGISQEKLGDVVGVSSRTIRRLEAGKIANPSFRLLVNCGIALGASLEEICDPDWLRWHQFEDGPARPPGPSLFRPGDLRAPAWVEEGNKLLRRELRGP